MEAAGRGATPPEPVPHSSLFDGVIFYIVISDKLPAEIAEKTRRLLLTHGATDAEFQTSATSKIPFDPAEVTHVIATDIDFAGYPELEEALKCIVIPEWVETSVQKGRLAHVRPFTPDPRLFFSGVVATTADLPLGDKEAICGGIIAMGGQYSSNLNKFTTHIVALNTDNEKCRQAAAKRLDLKMVLPHWFDDCLKLNRRIDEAPYILPNPEVERMDPSQPLRLPQGPDLKYAHSNGNMDKPPTPRPDFKLFSGKRVILGSDLEINPRLRGVLCDIIKQARGEVTEKVEDAHVYVGQWREGEEYIHASRRGLDVGNLTWLYWMLAHGKWTRPLKRLLHYPLVKGGIPGMERNIITVSNYGGDARLYLENLIEASGAKYTKSMKSDNTHLITARAHSEKCSAAREWNIHMVNHLWLEESYAKWQVQSISNPKYTHFPARTNLMEVVGQTHIDPRAIQHFYEPEESEEHTDGDTAMAEDVHEQGTTATLVRSTSTISGTVVLAKRNLGKGATHAGTNFSTPSKLSDVSPAWSTTSSARKAKEQASQRLHESIVPDMNLYEKEKKRKGGMMNPGRRISRSTSESQDLRTFVSIGNEPTTGDEEDMSMNESIKPNKRPKKKFKPSIKLLMTGYSSWSNDPVAEERDRRKLLDIGIQCVPEPHMCTHLAAPKIIRTEKFLCALAKAPIIVNTSWVEACLEEDRIVEIEKKHLLEDPEGEKRLDMKLSDSLFQASKNKGELLKQMVIYTTPSVNGGYETCKKIVEANGGVCVNFAKAKRGSIAGDYSSEGKIVLVSAEADSKYWKPFINMVAGMGKGLKPVILRTDWLLDLAMNQRIVWDDAKYAVPKNK